MACSQRRIRQGDGLPVWLRDVLGTGGVGGAVTGLARKKGIPSFKNLAAIRRYHSLYKVMNTRTLKIESTGDFFNGTVSPKIRLSGRWLERAGFKPGHRVEVQISQPGTLTLRFLEQSSQPAMQSPPAANTSCPDIVQGRISASALAWQGVLGLRQTNYRSRGH